MGARHVFTYRDTKHAKVLFCLFCFTGVEKPLAPRVYMDRGY